MSLTATMFGVDSVRLSVGNAVTIGALVVISGPELPNGAIYDQIPIDIDLTQTVNQIQTGLASGIRAFVLDKFGQTIPANGVNVPGFTKG